MLKWSCLELAINCSDDRTAPLLRPRDWVSFPFLVFLALPTLCPLWTPLASYFLRGPALDFFSSAMFTVIFNVEQYCHLWQEITAFPGHWFKDQNISFPASNLTLMIPLFWQVIWRIRSVAELAGGSGDWFCSLLLESGNYVFQHPLSLLWDV